MARLGPLPAKDRHGRSAWLGPLSLFLGLVSWVAFAGGAIFGLAAVGCGVVSIATRAEYRVDWTAVAGAVVGAGQLLLSLMLLLSSASGM